MRKLSCSAVICRQIYASPAAGQRQVIPRCRCAVCIHFERWACEQADAVVAVSEADQVHLQALMPGRETAVYAIPNSIDVDGYQDLSNIWGLE